MVPSGGAAGRRREASTCACGGMHGGCVHRSSARHGRGWGAGSCEAAIGEVRYTGWFDWRAAVRFAHQQYRGQRTATGRRGAAPCARAAPSPCDWLACARGAGIGGPGAGGWARQMTRTKMRWAQAPYCCQLAVAAGSAGRVDAGCMHACRQAACVLAARLRAGSAPCRLRAFPETTALREDGFGLGHGYGCVGRKQCVRVRCAHARGKADARGRGSAPGWECVGRERGRG